MTYNSLLRVLASTMMLAAPSIATAQTSSRAPANQAGPMVVEQVRERYAIAPEVRISQFDGTTGVFIGGHGGMLVGNRLLVGAGFYTMVNGAHGQGMTYGGGVVGWQWWNGGLFSGSARSLIGFGSGTTTQQLMFTDHPGHQFSQGRYLSSDFFVAEPQGDLLVRLSRHLHLDIGGGYRFTNTSYHNVDGFNGASGSVALRIGSAE